MAVNLSPIGGVAAQFFDNSGNLLSGGKIYTYAAGTTTPQATYTSAGGGTALANPIILDAAGRVPTGEIWLTDGLQYKFLIKTSSDVQIGSYDNIIGINSSFVNYTSSQEFQTATAGQTVFTLTTMAYQPGTNSLSVFVNGVNQYGPGATYAYKETSDTVVTFNAGLSVGDKVKFTTSAINASSYGDAQQISYTPPFTGSVPTNVELKLAQTVSVKDFGAVGNGVADDASAIQAAIDATSASGGGVIYLAEGTYLIGATLLMRDGVSIQGEGRNVTFIKLKNSANCNLIDKHPSSVGLAIGVFDLTFDGNQDNNTQGGVIFRGASGGPRGFAWTAERIIITKCRNADYPSGVKAAFLITGNTFGQFSDIDVWLNDYCNVAMWIPGADAQYNNIYLGTNCRSSNPALSSINCGLFITGGGNNFIGCYFGGTQNGPHVYMDGASCGWNRFVGCIFDNAGTNAIFLGVGVFENIFSGCRIGNSSYTDGGTYDTVYSDTTDGNNLFSGCLFYTYLNVGPPPITPPRYAYYESGGTTGGNHIVGCEFVGTWAVGVDGRQTNSTTKFAACRGFDYTESNDFFASNSLRVGTKNSSTAVAGGRIYSDGLAVFSRSGNYALALRRLTNDGDVSVFLNSAGTISGAITITGATTAYNTSSDYRLKENATRIQNALDKNDLLNPVDFIWKSDGKLGQGFIAHELQAQFPFAVRGEKDAVDADGNPVYQGVDASFLIGHLVACVQELRTEVNNLKGLNDGR